MNKKWTIVFLFVLLFSLSACNDKVEEKTTDKTNKPTNEEFDPNRAVVEFKDGKITEAEFYSTLKERYGKEILQQLVYEKILDKEFSVTEEDIEHRINLIKVDFPSEESFLETLQQNGIENLDALRKDEHFLRSIKQFKAITKDVVISEEEFDTRYNELKDQIEASHILVKTEEEALAVKERLASGESFEDIASEVSIDTLSANDYGNLGYFPKGKMVPEFEEVAFGLEVGEISDIVPSQFGFHIIKLTDKKTFNKEELEDKINEELLLKNSKPYTVAMDEIAQSYEIEAVDKDFESLFETSPIPNNNK